MRERWREKERERGKNTHVGIVYRKYLFLELLSHRIRYLACSVLIIIFKSVAGSGSAAGIVGPGLVSVPRQLGVHRSK